MILDLSSGASFDFPALEITLSIDFFEDVFFTGASFIIEVDVFAFISDIFLRESFLIFDSNVFRFSLKFLQSTASSFVIKSQAGFNSLVSELA